MTQVREALVLGGGTSGYFAAIALRRRYPALRVTLVDAPHIPIIGVGEATTTLMPPFLYGELGIDPVELHKQVRPTFKLGIGFDWGPERAPHFSYPFGRTEPLAAAAHDGTTQTQSLTALLMTAGKLPLTEATDGAPASLLAELKFAYHLDNASFVAFLARHAARVGVERVEAEVARVELDPTGARIAQLHTRDGGTLRADLYVDASGFRSTLLGAALGTPFVPFATSLFCDAAIVGEIEAPDAPLNPYTRAERMSAGWAWEIPVETSRHRGYVYSSSFLSQHEAEREFREKNPGLGDTWSLRFRSGRHEAFWRGNAVAVGNAYGFVEPLESTALHMVLMHLAWLTNALGSGPLPSLPSDEAVVARCNREVAAHWDYLRGFLAVHYRLCTRGDSEFWRACRGADLAGLEPVLERFRREGISLETAAASNDPAFGAMGLVTMVLGLDPETYRAKSSVPRDAWGARVERQRAYVARAASHRRGLELLRAHPALLHELTGPASWCSSGVEALRVDPSTGALRLPHHDPRE